jgi:annexin A7/11
MYGKDLIRDLKSELSGNFENIVKQMFMDNALFDAHCLRSAMKGAAALRCLLGRLRVLTRVG